jgi:hypothetical protein
MEKENTHQTTNLNKADERWYKHFIRAHFLLESRRSDRNESGSSEPAKIVETFHRRKTGCFSYSTTVLSKILPVFSRYSTPRKLKHNTHPVLLGRLPLNPPETSVELRQGLESHFKCNLASPQVGILEQIFGFFDSVASQVIHERHASCLVE